MGDKYIGWYLAQPAILRDPAARALSIPRKLSIGKKVTIEHLLCEGDMVAFRSVIRGTHQQPFAGFYPTDKQVVFRGMDFIRIANGKLVELWNCQETLNLGV